MFPFLLSFELKNHRRKKQKIRSLRRFFGALTPRTNGYAPGEAAVVPEQPMAGVCGGNVDAVLRRDRLLVREHLAGDQELSGLQPAAARQPRRGQGPRRQRRVPRRHPLRGPAPLGGAPHRGAAELDRLWMGLACRHWSSARFASLGGEWKWGDLYIHSILFYFILHTLVVTKIFLAQFFTFNVVPVTGFDGNFLIY